MGYHVNVMRYSPRPYASGRGWQPRRLSCHYQQGTITPVSRHLDTPQLLAGSTNHHSWCSIATIQRILYEVSISPAINIAALETPLARTARPPSVGLHLYGRCVGRGKRLRRQSEGQSGLRVHPCGLGLESGHGLLVLVSRAT
jgi:hypothetical protein